MHEYLFKFDANSDVFLQAIYAFLFPETLFKIVFYSLKVSKTLLIVRLELQLCI